MHTNAGTHYAFQPGEIVNMRTSRSAHLTISGIVMAGMVVLLSACSPSPTETSRAEPASVTDQQASASDESSTDEPSVDESSTGDAAVRFSTLTGDTAEAACETLFGSAAELAEAAQLEAIFDAKPFFLSDWSEYWYASGSSATLQCEAIGVPEEGGSTVPGDHRGAFTVMIDVNEPGYVSPVNCSPEDHPEHFYNVCIKDEKAMLRANMNSTSGRPFTPEEYSHVEQFLEENVRTAVSW
ncbi:hypothetical protein ABY45_16340 [Microbacterium maritypicum]|uniref:hypothetical protein n=1 Tax=Microbacterium maritypicum TaxID=33918 RepID=UPI003D701234